MFYIHYYLVCLADKTCFSLHYHKLRLFEVACLSLTFQLRSFFPALENPSNFRLNYKIMISRRYHGPKCPQTTANISSCPFRDLVGTFRGVWGHDNAISWWRTSENGNCVWIEGMSCRFGGVGVILMDVFGASGDLGVVWRGMLWVFWGYWGRFMGVGGVWVYFGIQPFMLGVL